MTLIAELRLSSPDLPLVAALRASPETALEVESAMADDADRPALFVWARGGDLDAFERAVRGDATVGDVRRLEDFGERRLYRVCVAADAPVVLYRETVAVGAARLDARATSDGIDTRIRFPDRDALRTFRARLVERGVDVSVRRLYSERDGDADGDADGLTEKQYETVATALDAGYFAVPRDASLADIADDLGVSRQAASERVRRAMATLAADAVEDAGERS
ncbi:helix-turn-helix domain-containing protein [Halarchaeum sp. CBA1220]|uniref:helix-turn-helix domain-containing protein n=1 Tax=Halarchaeum sp. CBA1220 TaxID=1853682 RepID=UPI000F3A83E9|nr:helix-turn-helix domain-containing protein [Halarchaeum sp. CBA1220]QLC34253.1 helix-turn-helix domain-containing protein [Halarchaeum sp. CBA1220]